VAEKNVCIGNKLVFKSPLGPDHFFSGKGLLVGGQWTDYGTGGTLVTFFKSVATGALHVFDEI
jgi:hypothetical protein